MSLKERIKQHLDFIIFPRFNRFHVLQLFVVQLSSFYPPYCREDVGRKTHEVYSKRLTYKDHRLRKKRRGSVPKRGRAFRRWKRKKKVGTEPIFIRSVPKKDHRRLWTLFLTERVKLERAKYRLHVKIYPSRST